MNNSRFIIQSTRSCFRKWRNTPRILSLFAMLLCFILLYALPFANNAKAQSLPLHWTEAFIAIMNWRFSMLLFSCTVLLLFCDLPCIDLCTKNMLIRGSRRKWIMSQILYIMAASFLVTLFMLLFTIIIALPNLSFSNEWSRPVKLLALSGRIAIPPELMRLGFSGSIVASYTPYQAFFHSFILFFLMACFYGFASLVLKLKFRSGSFVLLLSVNAISWASGMFAASQDFYAVISWFSIHYHATLFLHKDCAVNPLLPSLAQSYGVFACVIVLLLLGAGILVKRYDFVNPEEEQI